MSEIDRVEDLYRPVLKGNNIDIYFMLHKWCLPPTLGTTAIVLVTRSRIKRQQERKVNCIDSHLFERRKDERIRLWFFIFKHWSSSLIKCNFSSQPPRLVLLYLLSNELSYPLVEDSAHLSSQKSHTTIITYTNRWQMEKKTKTNV